MIHIYSSAHRRKGMIHEERLRQKQVFQGCSAMKIGIQSTILQLSMT